MNSFARGNNSNRTKQQIILNRQLFVLAKNFNKSSYDKIKRDKTISWCAQLLCIFLSHCILLELCEEKAFEMEMKIKIYANGCIERQT